MIADGEPGDTGAEFHHDTGALMPEDRRKIDHRVTGDTVPVAVTDTRSLHLDQDLTLPRWGERERLDRQGAFTARRTAASICTASECGPRRARTAVSTPPATCSSWSFIGRRSLA